MKRTLATALALVACTVMAGMASAGENGHASNGSYCKAYYGNQTSDCQHQYTGIANASSGTRYVACPVLVDEIDVTTGTTRVWLYGQAGAASDTISCTFFSMKGNGTTKQSKSATKTRTGWLAIRGSNTKSGLFQRAFTTS